jgi:hypothetical protein
MKYKHLFLAFILLMAGLIAISCVVKSDNNGDNNEKNLPNFVSDPCAGCKAQENIGSVTGIRFFSYVKNSGGDGTISMTIGAGNNNATQQFNVKAGTSYIFQASVPVEASSTTSFTYLAQFPGTPGFTDSHAVSGYHVTGAPFDLQMNVK